jgi:signal peptidase I
MFPTYIDDEIIFSTRLFRKRKIKVGDVIVFKHPYEKGRLLIKRVADLYYDKKGKLQSIYFLGDNSSDSYDSRNFGYVLTKDLVSKVLFSRKKVEL